MFKNMKVGTRLAIGFGACVAVLVAISAVSVLRMHQASLMTDVLIKDKLANERMVSEWDALIANNLTRTMAILKASDPAVLKELHGEIEAATKRIGELQQAIGGRIADPQAHRLFEEVKNRRTEYLVVRDAAMKAKESGADAAVMAAHEQAIRPRMAAYNKAIEELDQYQKKLIDLLGSNLHEQNSTGQILVIALAIAAVLVAVATVAYITTSLMRQLGGEPGDAARVADEIARGNLATDIPLRAGDRSSLMHSISAMRDGLAGIVGQVRSASDAIASASSQIASGNLELSSRTEAQAGSLEETASSMEEMTSTVRQNADNARQANGLVVTACEVAEKGGAVVGQVVQTMGDINESAKKIVDIISVIDGIAFQTNILALNAAVEAARAGEQGRGFAVVASEVRTLAQRSANAAKEIKELIGDSVEKVEVGSRLVDEAGATMQEIVDSVRQVTGIMGDITNASREQTSGIEQINEAITQMDQTTQQNAALVEEAAAAADTLQKQAAGLSDVVSVFRLAGAGGKTPAAAPSASSAVQKVTALAARQRPSTPATAAPARKLVAVAGLKEQEWEEF